ncbi:MAG TPA: hypothetical protein VEB21_07120 [Terriglobales bacterium]|nr:hypothetical protein [Terriglobales bacterium]
MCHLTPFLREDLEPAAALALLDRMVLTASDPRFSSRAGVSRREAVRTAVMVWGVGALRPRVGLRSIRIGHGG